MCPIPPLLPADTSDEKVVMFLDSRNVDDPIPSNVIVDVDPFTVDPLLSSGNHWYVYKSVILDIHDKECVIKGKNGYWEFMGDINIPTSTPTVGRKITREFCLGSETSGDKSTFRMHEYYIELENNKFKENSMSRIFSETDEIKNEEKCNTGCENTESKLPCLANQQERNSSLQQCENEFQVNKENEEQSELPNELMNEEAGFEDFIELKDLFDPEDANSSFSGNTSISVKSMTSDEHFESEIMGFDPEAMISDINANPSSVSSHPTVSQQALFLDTPVHPSKLGKSKSEESTSTSSSSESSGDSTSAKHSGNGSSSKRTKSRSARRMAKLGKRYCCFT